MAASSATSGPEKTSGTGEFVLNLFGAFECRIDGCEIGRLRSKKSKWLLALLALRSPREVDREWLAGTLWPESDNKHARDALRTTLKDLRRSLRSSRWRLRTGTDYSLSLDLAGAAVDVHKFDKAILEHRYADAAELYRGPLLEGCYEEWADREQLRREAEVLVALEAEAAKCLQDADFSSAERVSKHALSIDPYRESAVRTLLAAHGANRNLVDLERVYDSFCSLLQREIGSEPSPETRQFYQVLRSGELDKQASVAPSPCPADSLLERARRLSQVASRLAAGLIGSEQAACQREFSRLTPECTAVLRELVDHLSNLSADNQLYISYVEVALSLSSSCASIWHRTGTRAEDWGLMSRTLAAADAMDGQQASRDFRRRRARCLRLMGCLLEQAGRPLAALSHFERACTEAEQLGEMFELGMTYCDAAMAHMALGALEQVVENAQKGIELGRTIASRHILSTGLTFLGHALWALGNHGLAECCYRLAKTHATLGRNLARKAASQVWLARCRLHRGDFKGAETLARESLDGLENSAFLLPFPSGLKILASTLEATDRRDEAARLFAIAEHMAASLTREGNIGFATGGIGDWSDSSSELQSCYNDVARLPVQGILDLVRERHGPQQRRD